MSVCQCKGLRGAYVFTVLASSIVMRATSIISYLFMISQYSNHSCFYRDILGIFPPLLVNLIIGTTQLFIMLALIYRNFVYARTASPGRSNLALFILSYLDLCSCETRNIANYIVTSH